MKIKCIDNRGHMWFKKGKEYRAWKDRYGNIYSESELDETYHSSLNNGNGVFEMVEEEKSHPHADLMLKYAMIAQYDDKPWESFEVFLDGEWVDCEHEGLYAGIEYRLKPQEPKIKFGQVWIDFNGTQATVKLVSGGVVFFDVPVGGINIQHSLEQDYFLQNFNLKENK